MQRIFVFLFVKYRTLQPTDELGFFARLRVKRANEALTRSNGHIRAILSECGKTFEQFDGVVLSVLPELEEVSEQDVENWAGENDQLDLLDDIRALFRAQGRRTLSMRVVADRVLELMESRDGAKGEVA